MRSPPRGASPPRWRRRRAATADGRRSCSELARVRVEGEEDARSPSRARARAAAAASRSRPARCARRRARGRRCAAGPSARRPRTPRPATSPTVRCTIPSVRRTASYQSPPTSRPTAGAVAADELRPSTDGSADGSRLRWSCTATSCSRSDRRARPSARAAVLGLRRDERLVGASIRPASGTSSVTEPIVRPPCVCIGTAYNGRPPRERHRPAGSSSFELCGLRDPEWRPRVEREPCESGDAFVAPVERSHPCRPRTSRTGIRPARRRGVPR